MKLTPYHHDDPFQLLREFGNEIDSFFESPFKNLRKKGTDLAMPSLDISEDEKNVYVDANLPDFDQKDIKVRMKKDNLVISAQKEDKKEEKKKNFYRCERYQGNFYREVSSPQAVDAKGIKAKYTKGVLKVSLPKKEEAKEKEISIDVE
jgi:HSP20 family protein